MSTLKQRPHMREGRKQPRTPERFLVQILAVHDPRLADLATVENLSPRGARVATERPWELGSHVDIESSARELTARARVVYCQPVNAKTFAVGLDFLMQTNGFDARSEPATSKQQK
jgi:PilZ domain